MVFARYAGEDGERDLGLAPALGQAEESSSEQVGGEVLLGDRDLAGLPSSPEPVQVRKYDLLQDRLDVGREEPVKALLAACSSSRSSAALRLPAASSRVAADPESVRGSGSPPPRTRRAAWAAASPPDTRPCMRWTLASSAALYRRKPPGVRVGWRSPYCCSHRSSSGLTLSVWSVHRSEGARSGSGIRRRCSFTPVLYKQSTASYRPLTTSRGAGTLSTGPRQTLDRRRGP